MRIMTSTPWILSLAALASLGTACDTHPIAVSTTATNAEAFALTAEWPAFVQTSTPKLDLLFMVDNSSSMAPLQKKLAAGFTDFMTVLEQLPGGTPDLHIGVVSSSLGAGEEQGIAQCTVGGDRGMLQSAPVGGCMQTGLSDNYIAVKTDPTTGQLDTNFGAQALPDVFSCIALLGENGCGFEHQLASVRTALDPATAPMTNVGFLRADAFLAVVLITNEDDCSAPHNTTLFDQTSQLVSDPFGPLQSYRCNEYGHLCLYDGKLQAPPRQPDGEVTLSGCVSNEKGPLDPVADFVTFLKGLKGDPARVFLAAVTGPATPYVVGLTAPTLQDASQWPIIEHSCQDADGTYADPSVRIAQAVNAFGGHGLLASICDDTMGPVLQKISTQLSRPMAAPCVPTPDPSGPGCTVVDRSVADDGTIAAARVPSCDVANGATPCWTLVADATCGAGSEHLKVSRGGATVPATLVTAIDCSAPHP
ncbi:MAG TPA: hypothetical protein VH560_14965 [Polyangia bacterium]|jgi:hypothetical protein|nr:hypothetical protein [Polyangia bacterium]